MKSPRVVPLFIISLLMLAVFSKAAWGDGFLLNAPTRQGPGLHLPLDNDDKERHFNKSPYGFTVFGYHAWWMRDTWQSYDFGVIDKLMFFELRAGGDGNFDEINGWPSENAGLINEAKRTRTPIVPTIAVLDESSFRTLFASTIHIQTLLHNIKRLVEDTGANGVHLNFEMFSPISQDVRIHLTDFVRQLSAQLKAYRSDAELTVFTPGFDHPDVYDEAALALYADYLVVQGYDMHWSNGPDAGPLAPLEGWDGVNWHAIVQRYLDLGVPREKIVLTVPYYGYEWPTVSEAPGARTRGLAQTITYAPVDPDYLPLIQISAKQRTDRFGIRRDPASRSPYYVFQNADGWHQGWFEDAESLAAKYAFIKENNLAGIAIFLLGYDNGELLRTLNR